MADLDGNGKQAALPLSVQLQTMQLKMNQAEYLLSEATAIAAATITLCDRVIDDICDDVNAASNQVVAIKMMMRQLGAGIDSHSPGTHPPEYWLFCPAYNESARAITELEGDHVNKYHS